jgi:hypothetical protein
MHVPEALDRSVKASDRTEREGDMAALKLLVIGVVVGLLVGLAWPFVSPAKAQVGLNIIPDKLRFRLIGDEPIASPDARTIVPGWKVVVVRDVKSDQCYVTFIAGAAMSMTGPTVCP